MEPTQIKGICSACGSSIPLDAVGDLTTSGPAMYGLPQMHSHLCGPCAEGVANTVLAARIAKLNPTPENLAEFRRCRLAQIVPQHLFTTVVRRKTYRMKELLMLQPIGPRVLVKRIDAPRPASSTIIIPETVDGEQSCFAIVLAIGNKIAENIKVADTVILTPYCGSPVQVVLEGETLDAIIVMEADILAVVED